MSTDEQQIWESYTQTNEGLDSSGRTVQMALDSLVHDEADELSSFNHEDESDDPDEIEHSKMIHDEIISQLHSVKTFQDFAHLLMDVRGMNDAEVLNVIVRALDGFLAQSNAPRRHKTSQHVDYN